ncbi:hypothetical protein TW95_gp1312 [Pandoravirus inopinatum]|uniref:Uncharacterized protein n=1 Tax=Pandoravirus inopinatum TaxID=1605721 RepID=A0A0B5JAP9_9VIRU|nr:hypothetical protein TW95_gp1312 [Pandoravirus inopinatum]AJF98046.1 hypothetical protein [Pandoravirus inopinatum]
MIVQKRVVSRPNGRVSCRQTLGAGCCGRPGSATHACNGRVASCLWRQVGMVAALGHSRGQRPVCFWRALPFLSWFFVVHAPTTKSARLPGWRKMRDHKKIQTRRRLYFSFFFRKRILFFKKCFQKALFEKTIAPHRFWALSFAKKVRIGTKGRAQGKCIAAALSIGSSGLLRCFAFAFILPPTGFSHATNKIPSFFSGKKKTTAMLPKEKRRACSTGGAGRNAHPQTGKKRGGMPAM